MTIATTAPATGAPATGARRIRFADQLVLSKPETYLACEIIAHAERALRERGAGAAAARLGLLFHLLEERLAVPVRDGECERSLDVSWLGARTPMPGS